MKKTGIFYYCKRPNHYISEYTTKKMASFSATCHGVSDEYRHSYRHRRREKGSVTCEMVAIAAESDFLLLLLRVVGDKGRKREGREEEEGEQKGKGILLRGVSNAAIHRLSKTRNEGVDIINAFKM